MMETALRALLIGNGTIAGLVGTRIYWDDLPQAVQRPCLRLTGITELVGYHMQGPDGMDMTLVQIDYQSTSVSQLVTIKAALKSLLSGYRGTVEGVYFSGIFHRGSGTHKSEKVADEIIRGRHMTFEIWSRATS